jgi:hypothetical protein
VDIGETISQKPEGSGKQPSGSSGKIVMSKLAEERLERVQGAIAWYMSREMPLKQYELDELAKIVDPSPMRRGRDEFIDKHQYWEDE